MVHEYEVAKWISILYRNGQGYISRNLEHLNIGCGQYIYLVALYKKAGISQEELSDYLRIDKATTAKAIKKLEDEGYVRRDIDESDKRAYKVYVTQKALDVKPKIREAIRNWEEILSSGLSNEEIAIASTIFKKMAENAFDSSR